MRAPTRVTALLAAAAAGAAGGGAVAATGVLGGDSSTVTIRDAVGPSSAPIAASSTKGLTPRQVYDRSKDSVVFITAEVDQESSSPFGPPQSGAATGSGFVLSSDGYIVTNEHVIDGATSVKVKIGDGSSQSAKVVGSDRSTDLALLKVDAETDLTPLAFGDSHDISVGDPTYAIGNPFGLSRTLTTGVVSALQRQIEAPDGFTISDVIQTDAALNPGNSGGPLLDASGRVIGVNSQIETGTGSASTGNVGIGFAIPSNTVRSIVDQLRKSGTAKHAYLGVSSGAASTGGAAISSVVSGGPADDAGIKPGDRIVSLGGKDVDDAAALSSAVDAHKPGERVDVEIVRDGDSKTVAVTLGTRPASPASQRQPSTP